VPLFSLCSFAFNIRRGSWRRTARTSNDPGNSCLFLSSKVRCSCGLFACFVCWIPGDFVYLVPRIPPKPKVQQTQSAACSLLICRTLSFRYEDISKAFRTAKLLSLSVLMQTHLFEDGSRMQLVHQTVSIYFRTFGFQWT